jgi:catechol 2,3-dioxygenase-like lactoylglutathione lyase family enzyme
MSVTRINFTSIPVADQDRAIAFYRDRLGFEVQLDAPYQEGWRWIFLTLPGAETRLHLAKRDELSWQEGMPALTLVCDSVDDLAAQLRKAGVAIDNGPDDAPWNAASRWLMIRDSEDNKILIESAKEA